MFDASLRDKGGADLNSVLQPGNNKAVTLSSEIIESALAPFEPLEHIYIAYSGGVDSHVLLHLGASSVPIRKILTAVYVHHGLQTVADDWARHTAQIAEDLAVKFILLQVNATASKGESPEEAARNARYCALKELLGDRDALLVAQHLEDQLETVLLQLMRGSGLRGLSGMPEWMPFGRGRLLRPLLNVTKQTISDYAASHSLRFVDDPSNLCNDFDRNFLRNEVLPLLKQRWPSCAITVARTARNCAEAEGLVTELADEIFNRVHNSDDNTLSISRLRVLDSAKQQLMIRHWFLMSGLKMPSHGFVVRLLNQVAEAKETRHPELDNQGRKIRRYRDKLYCLEQSGTETREEKIWPAGQTDITVGKHLTLSWRVASAGIPMDQWLQAKIHVKFRSGGEKISLPGRIGRHSLKNLYQEAGIPPWERERIPLIYLNCKLAAVGDKWISSEFHDTKKDACIVLSMHHRE